MGAHLPNNTAHGRIDLGLGRAPGTDMETARALRRDLNSNAMEFPRDVEELQAYLGDPTPDQRVRAVPGAGSKVPIWLLGSSTFSAQLAGRLGLPFAFAGQFSPDYLFSALRLYRESFTPSEQLPSPYAMLGINAYLADDREQAHYLASSHQQATTFSRSDGIWSHAWAHSSKQSRARSSCDATIASAML